jgi:hypothetical protein
MDSQPRLFATSFQFGRDFVKKGSVGQIGAVEIAGLYRRDPREARPRRQKGRSGSGPIGFLVKIIGWSSSLTVSQYWLIFHAALHGGLAAVDMRSGRGRYVHTECLLGATVIPGLTDPPVVFGLVSVFFGAESQGIYEADNDSTNSCVAVSYW